MNGSTGLGIAVRREPSVLRILQSRTDSHPYSLGKARRHVRNALIEAGLGPEVVLDMEVAVGEVLANINEHAYDAGGGAISIKAFRAAEMLTVAVSDDGRATVAPSLPRGSPPPTGYRGRGLYMVGRLMDDVTISVNPAGHGLTVSMTKRVEDGIRKGDVIRHDPRGDFRRAKGRT